jgi:hypothetical protein
MHVACGCLDAGVPQHPLQRVDVGTLFHQVRRKTVPQGMDTTHPYAEFVLSGTLLFLITHIKLEQGATESDHQRDKPVCCGFVKI